MTKTVIFHQIYALGAKNVNRQSRAYCTNICNLASPFLAVVIVWVFALITSYFLSTFLPFIGPGDHPPTVATSFRGEYIGRKNLLSNLFVTEAEQGNIEIGYLNSTKEGTGIMDWAPIHREYPLADPTITSFKNQTEMETFFYSSWFNAKEEWIWRFDVPFWQALGGIIFHKAESNESFVDVEISILRNQSALMAVDLSPLYLENFIQVSFLRWILHDIDVNFALSHYRDFPNEAQSLDLVGMVASEYFTLLLHFLIPFFARQIVEEKLLKEMIKINGLKRSWIYWLVELVFDYFIASLVVVVLVISALIFGLKLFLMNNFLYLLVFICWNIAVVGQSFFLSIWFKKTSFTVIVGWIYAFVVPIAFHQIYSLANLLNFDFYFPWLPTGALYLSIKELSGAVSQHGSGLSWSQILLGRIGINCCAMFVEGILLIFGSIYLSNIIVIGPGMPKHPLFPIIEFYRAIKRTTNLFLSRFHRFDEHSDYNPPPLPDAPPDVLEEHNNVMEDVDSVIRVINLSKTYRTWYGQKETVAVSNVSFRIRQGECFALLGVNGSGKTTILNCLCGLFRPSNGSVQSNDSQDLRIGYCPQDNLLWPDMTGPEHIAFYLRLRGKLGKGSEIRKCLEEVGLDKKRDMKKLTKNYSGGMRRRLSVAIAFAGDTRTVILDEPTTGLDPASRREVWKIILQRRETFPIVSEDGEIPHTINDSEIGTDLENPIINNRAVLLTSHSMEEVEALCTRSLSIGLSSSICPIGLRANIRVLIITKGGISRCIGTPENLKSRFGKGFYLKTVCRVGLSFPKRDEMAKWVSVALGGSTLSSFARDVVYLIPAEKRSLAEIYAKVFDYFEDNDLVEDWALSSASLEDVFLRVQDENE